jgi:hypothetical protein
MSLESEARQRGHRQARVRAAATIGSIEWDPAKRSGTSGLAASLAAACFQES